LHLAVCVDPCEWVLEKCTPKARTNPWGEELDEWDYRIEVHQITEAEAIKRLSEALPYHDEWRKELQGLIGSRSPVETAAQTIPPSTNDRLDWNKVNQAIQEHLRDHPDQDNARQVAPSNQPFASDRLDWDAVNQATQEHLRDHPDQDTARQVAQAVSKRVGRSFSVGSLAKTPAWKQYQAEKNAKRSQSVHTQALSLETASRDSSDTLDQRELILKKIIQTATEHTRGHINGLKQDLQDELIDFLMKNTDKLEGSPEERQEILKLIVQQWLSDHGYSDEGWSHYSPARSRLRSRE
jgi:hypothetical protein